MKKTTKKCPRMSPARHERREENGLGWTDGGGSATKRKPGGPIRAIAAFLGGGIRQRHKQTNTNSEGKGGEIGQIPTYPSPSLSLSIRRLERGDIAEGIRRPHFLFFSLSPAAAHAAAVTGCCVLLYYVGSFPFRYCFHESFRSRGFQDFADFKR